MPKHEPPRTEYGRPELYPDATGSDTHATKSALRIDLEAALHFAEYLQANAQHLALVRWTSIFLALLMVAVSVSLLPAVIDKFALGPALIGTLIGFLAASASVTAALYFQRRLRTELRALYKAAQMLHEVAGTQQSELSPIQKELLSLRLSRLEYGSRKPYAMR